MQINKIGTSCYSNLSLTNIKKACKCILQAFFLMQIMKNDNKIKSKFISYDYNKILMQFSYEYLKH